MNAGILQAEKMVLIDRAEEHGHLSVDDDGSLRLTQKGWHWYETHSATREVLQWLGSAETAFT